MKDILKIIKSLEDSGLLLKGLVKQLKMKQKKKLPELTMDLKDLLLKRIFDSASSINKF